nr:MAG: hypothetical protein [Microvirus sp.]
MIFDVIVLVDGRCVAIVPLWMVKHSIEDAVAQYPDKKITLEVSR